MLKATRGNFRGQSIYSGIDVHKQSWRVSIYTEAFEHKTFTQPPDSAKLIGYLQRVFPGGSYHAVYEAGFSGFRLYDELTALGVNCMVVHPGDVPTTDKERRRKTDSRDSRKLARQLRSGELEAIHVPSLQRREHRSLLRQRKAVSRDLVRVKSRTKQFLHFHGIPIPDQYDNGNWSKSFLKWLKAVPFRHEAGKAALGSLLRQLAAHHEELLQMNRRIRILSRSDTYRDEVERLISLPGIGRLSAMIWLTELGDIHRFSSFDKLCSYVGLVPWEHSSGETQYQGGLDHRGNKVLRTLLIENAWKAVKKDPELVLAYHQLTKRMKGQQAIIRIARKLLARIRYVLIHESVLS